MPIDKDMPLTEQMKFDLEAENISPEEIELVMTFGYKMDRDKTISKQRKKPELTGRLFFNAYGNRFYKPLKKLRRGDM